MCVCGVCVCDLHNSLKSNVLYIFDYMIVYNNNVYVKCVCVYICNLHNTLKSNVLYIFDYMIVFKNNMCMLNVCVCLSIPGPVLFFWVTLGSTVILNSKQFHILSSSSFFLSLSVLFLSSFLFVF